MSGVNWGLVLIIIGLCLMLLAEKMKNRGP